MAAALATTVALAGVTASQPAAADGIITNWDFEINNGFFSEDFGPANIFGFGPISADAYEPQPDVMGSDPNVALTAETGQDMDTNLAWGSSGQSSIDVGSATNGQFMGSVATNGGPVNTAVLAHNNQTIPIGDETLLTATLLDVLTLTPTADEDGAIVGGSITNLPPLLFDIWFEETVNAGEPAGTCAPPSVGSPPCADIFAIDVTGAGFVATNGDVEIVQNIGGFIPENDENFDYFAILTIEDLQVLDDATCDATGMPQGLRINMAGECYGLVTSEGANNTFQVTFEIRGPEIVDMPEPGSLALLAFGLAGLGFAGRRKRLA